MKLKKVAIFSYSGQNTVSKTPYCRESAATKAAKKDLADKKAEGSFYHSDRTYACLLYTSTTSKFLASAANGTYTISFNATNMSSLSSGTKSYQPSITIEWDDEF